CASLLALLTTCAHAQDRRGGVPGEFDFYLLALSWSPTYCEESGGRRSDPQCGPRPYSFVVHGLWPQYEHGFPRACQVPSPRLPPTIVDAMLDVMPSPRLIYHEWDEHGTCRGLAPEAYFDTIRKARAKVQIPPQFVDVRALLQVTPDEVKTAFIGANPE